MARKHRHGTGQQSVPRMHQGSDASVRPSDCGARYARHTWRGEAL